MPMLGSPIESLRRSDLSRNDLVGVVVDNVDPQKRQRVRVRVPQLHRNVPDDQLPWSLQDTSGTSANAGAGVGTVNVPAVGSKLFVRFDENDPHNPRYGGSPPVGDVNDDNELLQEDYPHTDGFVNIGGMRLAINKEKQTASFTHTSGTTLFIDAQGVVSVSAKTVNMGAEQHINLVAGGRVSISGEGGVYIDGEQVHLNKGGAASAGSRTERTRPTVSSPAGKTGY